MNTTNIEGIDASLEISLKEYGIVWKTGKTETLFFYGIETNKGDYNRFDHGNFSNDLDVKREFCWMNESDWKRFLDCIGQNSFDQWNAFALGTKLFDLVTYFGSENVFGSSYWEGFSYGEVRFKLNNTKVD